MGGDRWLGFQSSSHNSQVRLVSLAASNTHTSKNTWRLKPLALHGTRSHLTGKQEIQHSIFKAKKKNQGNVSLLKHIQASNEKEDENIAKWQAGKAHVMLVNNENGGVFSNIKDNEDVNIKIKVNDELNGNTKKQLTAYSNPGKRINEDGEIVDVFIDKRLEREIDLEMQEMGKAQLSGDGSMQAKDPMDITSEDFLEENNPITPSNDSCAEGPEILADRKYIGRHEDNNMGLTPNLEKSPTSQGLSNTPQLSQERLPHTPNKLQAWEGILAGTIPVGQGAMEEGTQEDPVSKERKEHRPKHKTKPKLWTDNKLMNRSGVKLKRLEDSFIIPYGEEFLKMMMDGNSEFSVAMILRFAWNTISPTTWKHMFPEMDPTATRADVNPSSLSTVHQRRPHPLFERPIQSYFMPVLPIPAICAITYTAVSLLRLFTMSPNSYLGSWTQIKGAFFANYGFEFPYRWYIPSKESLEEICSHFNRKEIFKNGLTGLLYMHEKISTDRELRDYLFGHHLEYFNLHAFPLFMSVGKKLQCDAVDLLSALLAPCPQQETALDCLHVMLTDFAHCPQENRCLQTWKYARIYETHCFDSLDTSKCRRLVAVLAHLVKLCQTVGRYDEDVLHISALERLSAEELSDCKQRAEMIHAALERKKG
ncbi:hypothetical protein J5N97_028857 [Dioscorea zingiberensis]|uniref:Uncharacterized protein n=1 Tax=Dioscorea zingiberensis TaxID=325984 RepID=A0A9D5H5D3_9LILI|nr:hypothetical protein J5N97_028857 [Dioscorea zingiberensis]